MEFLNGPWGETVRLWGSILVVLYLANSIADAPWSKYDREQIAKILDRLRNPRP